MGIDVIVIAVVALAVVIGVLVTASSTGVYDRIGQGALDLDSETPGAAAPPSAALRDEEIRQMVDARNLRRAARGQPPLEVEDEVRRLSDLGGAGTQADAGLRAEVRQLVEARNLRRAARGQEPLDIDAETERRLQDLGGG
ncbi:MAG: hypothetical protein ACSLFR_10960 [Solirubrobacteraceae bacterium]